MASASCYMPGPGTDVQDPALGVGAAARAPARPHSRLPAFEPLAAARAPSRPSLAAMPRRPPQGC
jgi:hypothetical protein